MQNGAKETDRQENAGFAGFYIHHQEE